MMSNDVNDEQLKSKMNIDRVDGQMIYIITWDSYWEGEYFGNLENDDRISIRWAGDFECKVMIFGGWWGQGVHHDLRQILDKFYIYSEYSGEF